MKGFTITCGRCGSERVQTITKGDHDLALPVVVKFVCLECGHEKKIKR